MARNIEIGEERMVTVSQAQQPRKKKFVRYAEGAKLYSIGEALFARLAMEAHAVYKINHICLVNTEIFEEYLEAYRV